MNDFMHSTFKHPVIPGAIDLPPLHVKSVCHIAFYQPRPSSFLDRDNTESIRGDPYWISRKNSLILIELSSVNKVSLV